MLSLYFKIVKAHRNNIFIYLFIFLGIFSIVALYSNQLQSETQFQSAKAKVVIVDHDKSGLSKEIKRFLRQESEVSSIPVSQHKDAFFFNEIDAIITIPKQFEKDFNGGTSATFQILHRDQEASGVMLQQQLNGYLNTVKQYQKVLNNASFAKIQQLIQQDNAEKSSVKLHISKEEQEADQTRNYFFNYLAYVIFSILVLTIGLTMRSLYQSEVNKRAFVAPISAKRWNFQLIVANLLFGVGIWLIFMIIITVLRFSQMMSMSGFFYYMNSFIFVLVCVAFAFMVASFLINQKQGADKLNGICNIVGLLMSFLCGVFLPQAFIPASVLNFSKIFPAYYYVKSNELLQSLSSNATIDHYADIAYYMFIQIVFGFVFLSIGAYIMHRRKIVNKMISSEFE